MKRISGAPGSPCASPAKIVPSLERTENSVREAATDGADERAKAARPLTPVSKARLDGSMVALQVV